jgi:hypothetical protein
MRAATVTVTFSPIQAELLQCYADRHHAGSLDAATCALALEGLRGRLAADDALCDAWDTHVAGIVRAVQGWDAWGAALTDSDPCSGVSCGEGDTHVAQIARHSIPVHRSTDIQELVLLDL